MLTPLDGILSPYAPTTELELLSYLERMGAGNVEGDNRFIRRANNALGRIERYTRRRLVRRVYRTPVQISCVTVEDDATLAGTGFTSLREMDEVYCSSGILPWTVVASITSAIALEMSRKASVAVNPATVTFGSGPLKTTRLSEIDIAIPEYPVSEVLSVGYVDSDGSVVELDTTGAILTRSTGLYELQNDTFPAGEQRIVVECVAGFAPPTGSSMGDPEYADLQDALHRLAGYKSVDQENNSGRATSVSIGPASMSSVDYRMPGDVAEILRSFVRKW